MYTVTVGVGYLNGFGAVLKPWLPIPAEDYYFWETLFVIESMAVIQHRLGLEHALTFARDAEAWGNRGFSRARTVSRSQS
jgi:hypothetical protein